MTEVARAKDWTLYDLGAGTRRLVLSRNQNVLIEGKYEPIDLVARDDRGDGLVDKAPYALRLSKEVPAYRYTSARGEVAVELKLVNGKPIAPGALALDGPTYVWPIVKGARCRITPLRRGVATEIVLDGPLAPKVWSWELVGDSDLLHTPFARDAKGRICELEVSTVGSLQTITWTGRTASRGRLRRNPEQAWGTEVDYPVVIDPTVNEAITDGADDVLSYNSVIYASSTGIFLGTFNAAAYNGGFRFQNVALPQGAQITSATLTAYNLSTGAAPPIVMRIYGNDVDDAPAWGTANVPKNITKTTAFAWYSITATGAVGVDVGPIVQEIVNRASWASGNDMAFLIEAAGTGFGYAQIAAIEHATQPEMQLDITYLHKAAGDIFKSPVIS